MRHLMLSFAPGAALRMHARISRSFFRASLGAASMYAEIVIGCGFLVAMVLSYQSERCARQSESQRASACVHVLTVRAISCNTAASVLPELFSTWKE